MSDFISMKSDIDRSVNFVSNHLVGFVETRYVRKTEEYFIAYLSSQTGCNHGCQFCHLTATGQKRFDDCDIDQMLSQAKAIYGHYDRDTTAKYMHYNFMARGEPLSNVYIQNHGDELLYELGRLSKARNLPSKFNISTIMPIKNKRSLTDIFGITSPTIYYSIYSANEEWRDKWLPAALPVREALSELAEYQKMSKKVVKFHSAFIKNENDNLDEIRMMMAMIQRRRISGEFNIVRYNPYSLQQGAESERLSDIVDLIGEYMPVKVIPRVGFDVKASCGMFVQN